MAEYIIKVGEEGFAKPTVMRELVRCNNCTDYQINYHWCELHYMKMQPTDFCNYGERKGGEQT